MLREDERWGGLACREGRRRGSDPGYKRERIISCGERLETR